MTSEPAPDAATLLAVDPVGLAGAVLRATSHELGARWIRALHRAMGAVPMRRIPIGIHDDRLLGGLDLAATLTAGKPVMESGVLAAAHGGVAVLPMAERASDGLVAKLSAALDTGVVESGHGGVVTRAPARFAFVAIDEGADDEAVAEALSDRVAFLVAPSAVPEVDPDAVLAARARLSSVTVPADAFDAIVRVALVHGVESLRAASFAMRAARASAAWHGRTEVAGDDLAAACALVLGPRATRVPSPPSDEAEPPPPPPPPPQDSSERPEDEQTDDTPRPLDDVVVQLMAAALPAALLAMASARDRRTATSGGRAGSERSGGKRGRQVGSRRGDPRTGARLDLLETLRTAAPWQGVRRRLETRPNAALVRIHPDDFRVRRLVERAGTTAIFVVDASGSTALNRLAEAKGAVELLLGESYARRDQVQLIAFRGTTADILLPPTRAIAAVKRALAALPGGGGTPLATAIGRAHEAALLARREGQDAVVVFLTDARANVGRDGKGGRPDAERDARDAAKAFGAANVDAIFIDNSPRPSPFAAELALLMQARYVALPRSDARAISHAVRDAGVWRPATARA